MINRIKGDTEGMENGRQGGVTKKEEQEEFLKNGSPSLPLKLTGRCGRLATGKARTLTMLCENCSFLVMERRGESWCPSPVQKKVFKFLILSLVILNSIKKKSHERLDKVGTPSGKMEVKSCMMWDM